MNAKSLLALAAALLALGAAIAAEAAGFAGLGEDRSGFEAPARGRPLSFPRDFGAHPTFRIEWWYLTANLTDDAGASYGVQWTLFRRAIEPGPEREGWADQNIWMAHAAVTSAGAHVFAEKFARGGVGQAGVSAEPFEAWIDDWRFAADGGGGGLSRLRLSAGDATFRYMLDLETDKAPVPQGEGGFSRKSTRGQASHYFSQPFFTVRGALGLGGREIHVSGKAWMDREWSSQALSPDQKGWDWFALHLSSGEKVMLYRFRSDVDPAFYAGTWIAADGTAQPLDGADIELAPLARTAISGRTIPIKWKVGVKSRGLEVETAPLNPGSWMGTSFAYWEGPIRFVGSHQGVGYLEMTGY